MEQKHNGQDGQCQQRLNTYATKFFTRAIATLEVEAWGKDMAKLRIERACRLLANGSVQIKKVVQECGFASDSTFRRAFKRVMGVSPSDYRPS